MARLTFDEIVAQGQLLGQNQATPIWVARKLKAWLRKHHAGWAWPHLIAQATGISYGTAQADGLLLGAGVGGLTPQISRLFGPVYFRANSYSTRGKAHIRTQVGDDAQFAIGQVDSAHQRGMPQSFIAMPVISAAGLMQFQLTAYPTPDITYTLAFTYQKLPDDPAGSEVPPYPNEMTLIQAAKVAALEYDQTNDPIFSQESNTLAQMVGVDRATYGATPSFGDVMQLDSSVFLP